MVRRQKSGTVKTENSASAPALGTVQNRGSQFPACCEFTGILWPCDRRIHRLVLLGTTTGLRPDRCAPVSILPGAEQPRSIHYQCALGRRPPTCVRGCRHGTAEPGTGCGHSRAKRLGFRIGNWLTVEQSKKLLQTLPADTIRASATGPSWLC